MNWVELLRQQLDAGFPDIAGARAAVAIPVSEQLATRLARESIPDGAPVRVVELHARGSNRFDVRLRLTRPSFLPAVTLSFVIERQPQFPVSPVLGLRAHGTAMTSMAVLAAKRLELPPGVSIDGEAISIDLHVLAARHGAADLLRFIDELELAAEEGRFVIALRVAVAATSRAAP